MRNGHLATYHQLAKSLFEADAIDSVHTMCQELGAPRKPSAYSTPSQPLYYTSAPVTAEEGVAGYLNNAIDHPQLSSLVTTLNDLSWNNVKQMAIHLDKCVDLALLTDIEREYPIEERLLYTMKAWLERDCEASWAKVVYALRMIEQNVLSMKIEAKYYTIQKPIPLISASSPDPTPEVIFSPTTEPQLNTPSQPENEATSSSICPSEVIPTSTASPIPAFDPSAAHLHTYNSECHSIPEEIPGEAETTFVTQPSDFLLVTPLEQFEQLERDREASWAKVVYALSMLWHQGRRLISQVAIQVGLLIFVAAVLVVVLVALTARVQGGVALLYTYVPKTVVPTAMIAIATGGAVTAATKAPTITRAVVLYGVAAAEIAVLALYEASTDEGIGTASVVLAVGIVTSVAVAEASRRGTPAAPRARAVIIAAVAGVAGTGAAAAAVGTAAEVRGAIAVGVTGATGVVAAAVVVAVAVVAAATGRGGAAARAGPVVIAAVAAAAGTGAAAVAAGVGVAGVAGAGAAAAVVVGAGIAPWFIPMTAGAVGTVIGAQLTELFMPVTAAAAIGAGVVGVIVAIAARADSKPLEAIVVAVAVGAIALAAGAAAEPTVTTAAIGAGVVGVIAAIAARADSKPLEAIAAAVAVGAIALAAGAAAEPTVTSAAIGLAVAAAKVGVGPAAGLSIVAAAAAAAVATVAIGPLAAAIAAAAAAVATVAIGPLVAAIAAAAVFSWILYIRKENIIRTARSLKGLCDLISYM